MFEDVLALFLNHIPVCVCGYCDINLNIIVDVRFVLYESRTDCDLENAFLKDFRDHVK